MSKSDDYQKACLYDVEWQALRVSMLDGNNSYGGWSNMYGAETNLRRLSEYCDEVKESGDLKEYSRRIWRALNLINAVLLGYGNRKEVADIAHYLRTKPQGYYSRMWDKLKTNLRHETWDWDKVGKDLIRLRKNNKELWGAIYINLQKRVKTSIKRNGGLQHRSELEKFIELMEASSE